MINYYCFTRKGALIHNNKILFYAYNFFKEKESVLQFYSLTHTYIWISFGLITLTSMYENMECIRDAQYFIGACDADSLFLEYILLRLIDIACIGKVIFLHELGFFIIPQFKYIFNCVHIIR